MSNYQNYTKRKKGITVALLILSVVILGVVTYLVGKPLVRFASSPEVFREWVDSHGIWGKVFFVGVNTLQIILAFIPGEPLEIAAGYAFGAVEGTVLCLIAAALGGMIVFLLVRTLGKKLVNVFFDDEKLDNLKFLKKSPARDLLLFIIFFIPGTPKDLICYAAGLTDVKFYIWLVICTVGRIPSIITSTIGGNALGTQRYVFATVTLVITLILSGLGLLLYRHITKKASAEEHGDDAAGTEGSVSDGSVSGLTEPDAVLTEDAPDDRPSPDDRSKEYASKVS